MNDLTQWFSRNTALVGTAVASLAVVIATGIAIAVANRLTRRLTQQIEVRFHFPAQRVLIVCRIVTTILWGVAALVILSLWGVGVGGVWTFVVSAVTLIGVGFLATWSMISNITANLFLTIWRPFRMGEAVSLLPEDLRGQVVGRDMMFTMLREDDGGLLVIPNNLFFQKMFRVGGKALAAPVTDDRENRPERADAPAARDQS
jgi:small-conductance mechanosensitive channel